MKKRFRRLKHYLLPHAGNKFKPGVFARDSVAAIALVLVLVEGVYVFVTPLVMNNAGFTASVLPAALTDLTNADRIASGYGSLTVDTLLTEAAQKKADDMAQKGYFAHVSPDGKDPWYWFDAVGYHYTYAGENLAINFTDSADVEVAWMNSPAHHANIVKPEFTRIGIATARGMYEGKETTFVVELFATQPPPVAPSKPKPAPTKPVASAAAPTTPPAHESQVLAAQVDSPPATIPGAVATAASSPNRTLTYLLAAFAAAITLLLGIAIFVKKKAQYLEVVGGGAVLIALALACILLNGSSVSTVELPHDNQAASASLIF